MRFASRGRLTLCAEMANEDTAPAAERFPVAQMIAESGSRFDHPSWEMAGALYGYRNETITETDARKRLDAFLKREVTS